MHHIIILSQEPNETRGISRYVIINNSHRPLDLHYITLHLSVHKIMIHILGVGSIGSLLATELCVKHSVRLIMRSKTLERFTKASKSTIKIHNLRDSVTYTNTFPAATAFDLGGPIEKLILTVKAYDIHSALNNLKNYITPKTEILIMHNGMGVDRIVKGLWKESEKPQIAYGISRAGVARNGPTWDFRYTGNGTNIITHPPGSHTQLAGILTNSSNYVYSEYLDYPKFVAEQQVKLIINSVTNPLTALLECENGRLLELDEHMSLIKALVHEGCKTFGRMSEYENIYNTVVSVLEKTAKNRSSMLSDVEGGGPSEIDVINGYMVEEAKTQNKLGSYNWRLQKVRAMSTKEVKYDLEKVIP